MEFRLGTLSDLPQIKQTYKQIIRKMKSQGLNIWDDIYPLEFFKEDLVNQRLYVLVDKQVIVAAFSLNNKHHGQNKVVWNENTKRVLYLDRLGVNINYANMGIGSLMLEKAKELAEENKMEYLRLFVVTDNYPAIKLYQKNGFIKAIGIYHEKIDDMMILNEYGYEIKL
ncbi:GNAT family N-acetyltransferase [uncultured Thomasclavelia sp.]|uniref:GNAT family N-acetyltransferase n=1 Tax=uncultured Thomasclavelia sp. TaxID=3025759 RepID=UPI0025CF4F38|nr:GNAT family N-acetyltransferase [uncultured Thomasclavelia sp.]